MAQYVVGMATFTPGTDRNKYGWFTSNGDNISTFFSGGLDAVLPDASLVATNYPGVDTAIVPGGSVLQIDIWPIPSVSMEEGDEEFRNSHGGAPSAGVGTSYLCCSNCDERYSNCDGINRDAVTIARADQ